MRLIYSQECVRGRLGLQRLLPAEGEGGGGCFVLFCFKQPSVVRTVSWWKGRNIFRALVLKSFEKAVGDGSAHRCY